MSQAALKTLRQEIMLTNAPFSDHLVVICPRKEVDMSEVDVNDDLKREVALYVKDSLDMRIASTWCIVKRVRKRD